LSGEIIILKQVNCFKYLGVTIKNNFKWDRHINQKVSEATRTLGLLRRTLFGASARIKEIAYKSLCRPKLEFAAEV
jgi:hypothetical protein